MGHLDEKALLPPLLLLSALAPSEPAAARLHARALLLLSATAHYSLLPLLFRAEVLSSVVPIL